MACRDLSEIPAQQRLDVVRLLLEAGAELEARDKYGHTAGRMALELYSTREDSRSVTAAEEHIALRKTQKKLMMDSRSAPQLPPVESPVFHTYIHTNLAVR